MNDDFTMDDVKHDVAALIQRFRRRCQARCYRQGVSYPSMLSTACEGSRVGFTPRPL